MKIFAFLKIQAINFKNKGGKLSSEKPGEQLLLGKMEENRSGKSWTAGFWNVGKDPVLAWALFTMVLLHIITYYILQTVSECCIHRKHYKIPILSLILSVMWISLSQIYINSTFNQQAHKRKKCLIGIIHKKEPTSSLGGNIQYGQRKSSKEIFYFTSQKEQFLPSVL